MRFDYDKDTDSLYIHFARGAGVDTVVINDEVVADIDATGQLIGLDIQHASRIADLAHVTLDGFVATIGR